MVGAVPESDFVILDISRFGTFSQNPRFVLWVTA